MVTFNNNFVPPIQPLNPPIIINIPVGNYQQTNFDVFKDKKKFVHHMVRKVRDDGGAEFWVLNKKYLEIYQFKATQVSDFDVQIEIINSLVKEHLFTGTFVLHMKDHILKLLEEVPGVVYNKKLDCYRELYQSLYEKAKKTKSVKNKAELVEKIEFIETEFPQFVI
jgi:hypothetical protein